MEVHMSPNRYNSKPFGKAIGRIRNETLDNIVEIDIRNFAYEVGNYGRVFFTALLHGGSKSENFIKMQIFALDFDNKDGSISFNDIKTRAENYGLKITFAYETFSLTRECQRFRVVFILKFPIDQIEIAHITLQMLLKIFPEADPSCKDVACMFYGGKNLIYLDENARFHMVDNLLLALCKALDRNKNLTRNLSDFARKNNIMLVNNKLAIFSNTIMIEIDEKRDLNINNNILKVQKSSILSYNTIECGDIKVFICNEEAKTKKIEIDNPYKKKSKMNIEGKRGCQLLNDFFDGVDMHHQSKFMILTNLIQIKNGEDLFLNTIKEKHSNYKKWSVDKKYVKGYSPQRCSEDICPYYQSCNNGKYKNILDVLRRDREITFDNSVCFGTLEEAENNLYNNLITAMKYPDCWGESIHLIKAQTGLGKTTAIINYIISHPAEKFIIASPINYTKEEIAEKLKAKGVNIFVTPSYRDNAAIPQNIQDEISKYLELGLHKEASSVLKQYYKDIKGSHDLAGIKECERILSGIRNYEDEQVIVTTHAYYLTLEESFVSKFNVIIDEDILYLTLANRHLSVSEESLKALRDSDEFYNYKWISEQILNTPKGEYGKLDNNLSKSYYDIPEKKLNEIGCTEDGNVNDLKYAISFIRDPEKDSVIYLAPMDLHKAKTIILSATCNIELYKRYFRSRKVIEYPDLLAHYFGKLKQYSYHSLGRSDLNKRKESIRHFVDTEISPTIPIITFKSMDFGPAHKSKLHYGNGIGVNVYEGKDLAVIGTPFKNEICYKLLAAALGEKITEKDVCRKRSVYYKGYTFEIMSYKNELLRLIQLNSLESEIEQCVGRARLLRNNCTVHLLCCFPAEQADLNTNEYLVED